MESLIPFANPAWVSSRLFLWALSVDSPSESTRRMAPGTERRVLTSDLPLAPLRVLASSRETNGLPYPIERAIRKKLPRLAASDKSSLGMRQSIEAYGLAPLDHRPQTPQMAPFFVPEHHSPALATRHSRQLDHPRHRVTQHRHTASSHSIVTQHRHTASSHSIVAPSRLPLAAPPVALP